MISGSFYALLAGCMAAAGSLCAKLTVGADYLKDMCEAGFKEDAAYCDWVRLTSVCVLVCLFLITVCFTVAPYRRLGSSL